MLKNKLFIMRLKPEDYHNFIGFGFTAEQISDGQWFKQATISRFGIFCTEWGMTYTREIKNHVYKPGQYDSFVRLYNLLSDCKAHVEYPLCKVTKLPLLDHDQIALKRL